MDKPILLDAILEQEEKWIEQAFPFGAIRHEGKNGKPDRWSPADDRKIDSSHHRSLRWLLREKRKRVLPIRLMGKQGGYTTNPAHALYTKPDSGEAIDEISQREYSEEGWQGFLGGLEAVDTRHPRLYVQRRIQRKNAA